jgi:hypothetical protein
VPPTNGNQWTYDIRIADPDEIEHAALGWHILAWAS